jgi:hypothetical protein
MKGTFTNRCDRLPKEINIRYLHHKKTKVTPQSKAARFIQPIVGVKLVNATTEHKAYVRTICLFQSTSSTNIVGVNNANEISLFAARKQRGQGEHKKEWPIEMNYNCALYCGSYSQVDTFDHYLKNTHIKMISWKYWHAPRLHLLKASVVVAYQLYTDCWDWCKEQRGTQWEQKQLLDFTKFQQKLGMQMCKFDPRTSSLPAAAKFRQVTRMTERDREKNKRKMSEADQRMYEQALSKKRLCGNLMDYHSHWQ